MDNRVKDGREGRRNPGTGRISGAGNGEWSNDGKRRLERQQDRDLNSAGKEEEEDSQELELTEETDGTNGKD